MTEKKGDTIMTRTYEVVPEAILKTSFAETLSDDELTELRKAQAQHAKVKVVVDYYGMWGTYLISLKAMILEAERMPGGE